MLSRLRPRAVLVAMFGSMLAGCIPGVPGAPGQPGGGDKLIRQDVDATLVLPAGMGMTADQATLKTMLGSSGVGADGKARVATFAGGSQLTCALGPDGTVMLLGWIDPAAGRTEVSARSTAEALMFFDLGGWLLSEDLKAQLIEKIHASPEVDDLAAAIAQALAADPHGLSSDAVKQARSAAAGKLMGKQLGASSVKINTPKDSGIEITQPGFNNIVVTNHYRRRATAFINRVSPEPAELTTVKLSPVTGTSTIFGTLTDLAAGRTAYAPVSSDPVDLPIIPADADKATYHVTVVGLGAHVGDYYSLTQAQKDELRTLTAKTLIIDLVTPLVANTILPAASGKIDKFLDLSYGTDFLGAIVTAVGSSYPNIIDQAISGDVKGATLAVWQAILHDPAFRDVVIDGILRMAFHFTDFPAGELNDAQIFAKSVLGAITLGDMGLTFIDSIIQGVHIGISNVAKIFEVEVTKSKVVLSPQHADIGKYDLATFSATVPSANGDNMPGLTYKWTTTGKHGSLRDANFHSGTSFESSANIVSYAPNLSSFGEDDVTVEAFEIKNNQRQSIGTATVKVMVRDLKPEMFPRKCSLRPGMPGGTQTFTVTVDQTLQDGGTLNYEWSVDKGLGQFEFNTDHFSSGNPQHYFSVWSESEGVETVRCKVTSTKDGVISNLGSATAEVKIENRRSIIFGSRRTEGYVKVDGGWYESGCGTFIAVPLVPDAKTLAVYAYNFNDTAYFGRTISRTISVANPGQYLHESGEYRIGLTGGVGFGPIDPNNPPVYDAPACESSFDWRFSGMIVEVTVTY